MREATGLQMMPPAPWSFRTYDTEIISDSEDNRESNSDKTAGMQENIGNSYKKHTPHLAKELK